MTASRKTPAPLFSVVIPTYNRAPLLARALAALTRQTFRSFEVVVVDDGSKDETSVVAEGAHGLDVHFVRQTNAGPSAARNHGTGRSSGSFLVFLDDDDEPAQDWLSGLAELVGEGPARLGVVSCAVDLIDTVTGEHELCSPADMGAAHHSYCALFLPGAYAIRRELFERAGGFCDEIRYGEHHEMALRALALCAREGWEVVHTPRVLLVKYHERTPETWQRYLPARIHSVEYQLRHHRELLARDGRILAGYYALGGVAAVQLGDVRRARDFFLRGWLTRPWDPRHLARLLVSVVPPLARRIWT